MMKVPCYNRSSTLFSLEPDDRVDKGKKVSGCDCEEPETGQSWLPNLMEIILTLLLLHAEVGFIISIFKLFTLQYSEAHSYPFEEGLTLGWLTLRSFCDMYAGFRFLIGTALKDPKKFSKWISYALPVICFDLCFTVFLFHKNLWYGNFPYITADALVKILIILIMHDLRKKCCKGKGDKGETLPLIITTTAATQDQTRFL